MTVNWAGTAFSLILVAVAAGLSLYWGLGLERSILWAAVRAGVQLLLVGGVLVLLLRPQTSLWWSWLWVVAMLGYAAWTSAGNGTGVAKASTAQALTTVYGPLEIRSRFTPATIVDPR